MTIQRQETQRFFDDYGSALGAGRLDDIARAWDVPAAVFSENGTVQVTSAEQIREIFGAATQWHHLHGMRSTTPSVTAFEPIGGVLASVDVLWRARDSHGEASAEERSRYIVRRTEAGGLRICAAIMLTPPSSHKLSAEVSAATSIQSRKEECRI